MGGAWRDHLHVVGSGLDTSISILNFLMRDYDKKFNIEVLKYISIFMNIITRSYNTSDIT